MTVSVVICCYTDERWEQLRLAIDSVRRQSAASTEIVVAVDYNAALLARVAGAYPDVLVVPNSGAKGLSGARNAGIAASSCDVVAFIDDDAVAAPDWLELLMPHYLDAHVLAAGGLVGPMWTGVRPAWFPDEFGWVVGCSYAGLPEQAGPVRNLIGCNMSFRRFVLTELGGFSAQLGRQGKYPAGCEETELCIRALQRWPGSTIVHEPRAVVRQWVPESRARWSYFRRRCYAEGLSKATVSRLVGTAASLASERRYTTHVLPRAAARGIGGTLLHGDRYGAARAGAIGAGLAFTACGYLAGRIDAFTRTAGPRRARQPRPTS